MLIPSDYGETLAKSPSLSRRVNANSQPDAEHGLVRAKLIKKGEC